jgi:hypothetical protein
MRNHFISLVGFLVIMSSCAPKISTSISKNYAALDYREDVWVFGVGDAIPEDVEQLGTVKIGDTGFTTDCSFETVIEKAKTEARKIGGNAIKIIKHDTPSVFGSSCHRITANIIKIDNTGDYKVATTVPNDSLVGADYALLHIYRTGGAGALISFDLHLGDTVICRVSNNKKETIKIDKDGLNILWARTESKTELPIDIQFENEYYIRCSLNMGILVGRPKLEIIDNQTGRMEFQAVAQKKKKK